MEENNNAIVKKSNTGLIVFLIIIILGLAGYICYDKFIKKTEEPKIEEDNNKQETSENEEKKEEQSDEETEDNESDDTELIYIEEETREGFKEKIYGCGMNCTTSIIYSKNNETIVEYVEPRNEYDISDEKLYLLKDSNIYVYDNNGKELRKVVKNNVLGIIKKYAVVLENNIIYLYDALNDITIKVEELDKGYAIYQDFSLSMSGYYDKDDVDGNHKPGYYIMATNFEIDSLDENLKEYNEDGELLNAYEYYYIPETGETGKIKTYVGGYAKPILYLYPEKDNTKVTVKFSHPENLTTTYPKFKELWNVTANKNGDLYDESGKYYYGLYWEENSNKRVDFSEGFYVTKENAIDFLEEKLSIIGLNDKERNEFIMYWLPILEKNEKNLVYFELTEERDELNKLIIEPKPDSLLRLAIHVKKVDKKINIKEEKLETFKRVGFIAVEWGGVIY